MELREGLRLQARRPGRARAWVPAPSRGCACLGRVSRAGKIEDLFAPPSIRGAEAALWLERVTGAPGREGSAGVQDAAWGMNGPCQAVRKHLGPWGSPNGGAQSLGAIGSICLCPRAGRNLCPYGLLRPQLLREGRTARAWGGELAVFCPAQVPNLPRGKVARENETTCLSCTPGGVFESNPGLEGPAWRTASASPPWESGAPEGGAQLPSLECPRPPDLPRSAVPVSDSCLAQVPPVTTPQSTRNTAFAILLPPGLGVLEMGCPGCALSFVLFSAKPLKAPSGFTSRFCSYTW